MNVALVADVVQGADVGVGQRRDRPRLDVEARVTIAIGNRLRQMTLSGDGAIEADVASFVDLAHAPGAQGAQ